MTKKWQALKRNDIVDIIAPASGTPLINIEEGKNFIKSLGLIPRIAEDIIINGEEMKNRGLDPFCANSDQYRFEHLRDALLATDSKAVWCFRGGYGSARLIADLEKLPVPEQSKLFIGFSDITALHLFLNQKWHWTTIHGKVLNQFCGNVQNEQSVTEITNLIFGQTELTYHGLLPMNDYAKGEHSINGVLTGGNLCLVETSIGTPWQIDSYDKILFLEEVNEAGYRVDRSLEHLKQAGILNGVKAVLLGDFIPAATEKDDPLAPYALKRFAGNIDVPVFSFPGIGHGSINHPLPIGTTCILKTGNYATLFCSSGIDIAGTIKNCPHDEL